MDPISSLVAALVAGASAALKDEASAAVKDAYEGLKNLIVSHWENHGTRASIEANKSEAEHTLSDLQDYPEDYTLPVVNKLKRIIVAPSPEMLDKVERLQQALEASGDSHSIADHYEVIIESSKNTIVGSGNSMTITETKV